MSSPRPLEEVVLAPAEQIISEQIEKIEKEFHEETRFQILESAAALLGGFDLDWYKSNFDNYKQDPYIDNFIAPKLCDVLRKIPVHPSMVLASLARPKLSKSSMRSSGAYYTDFRLASYLTDPLRFIKTKQPKIIDPASGTGILLVSAVLSLSEYDKKICTSLIAESVCAADLSSSALRGAALSLSSLTNERTAISNLLKRLRQCDSLLVGLDAWKDIAPNGFQIVVGNPPWEKLKISRHEFITAAGVERHYGDEYEEYSAKEFSSTRDRLNEYNQVLSSHFKLQGKGELDLYKFFIELATKLVAEGGKILFLVPAGLIRSLGTQKLRQYILDFCSEVSFTVLDNRSRFFSIDTRFKFLALQAQSTNGHEYAPIKLNFAKSDNAQIRSENSIKIERNLLYKIRSDFSIPEVRSEEEWKLFFQLSNSCVRFGGAEGSWSPRIVREIDMTQDREYFQRNPCQNSLPLIEGRMIHQYSHAAKRYISGTGRRAMWDSQLLAKDCQLHPQFWMESSDIPQSIKNRVDTARVGFCDISGQTNERTMLAAKIPPMVVCGNKVPTILFKESEKSNFVANCWLAIANSFLFDWLLRRVVTTTVNFFLLLDLPMPNINTLNKDFQRLCGLVDELSGCSHFGQKKIVDLWKIAEIRSEIDLIVLGLYGQNLQTLKLVLKDFPLLDRSQAPIQNEKQSTITKDFLLLNTAEAFGEGTKQEVEGWRSRVSEAREKGAVPYLPSHLM